MLEANTAPQDQPRDLTVSFHPVTQMVGLKFKTDDFKNWSFVIGVLQAALEEARFQHSMAKANALQKQMAEHQQAQAIAQQIKLGRM